MDLKQLKSPESSQCLQQWLATELAQDETIALPYGLCPSRQPDHTDPHEQNVFSCQNTTGHIQIEKQSNQSAA